MSDFAPLINDDNYHKLNDWFKERNGGPLVDPDASSRKLKSQTKMISIIKASLKDSEPQEYTKFVKTFNDSFGVKAMYQQAIARQQIYRSSGVPALIVNGKYRIEAAMVDNSNANMLKVADFLIERERRLKSVGTDNE